MSMYFREHGECRVVEYPTSRTKQAFKEDCDIRKILARAEKTGVVSHLAKYAPEYGDFGEFDFLGAQLALARGNEIFAALPGELRREFNQSPAEFFSFVNDPANVDRLPELLPGLAAPGNQLRDVSSRTPPREVEEPVAPVSVVEESSSPQ